MRHLFWNGGETINILMLIHAQKRESSQSKDPFRRSRTIRMIQIVKTCLQAIIQTLHGYGKVGIFSLKLYDYAIRPEAPN